MKGCSCLIVLLLFVVNTLAQDSLRFVSATSGAACFQVKYYNNHLFTGTGTTLRLYDVSGNPPFDIVFEYRFRSIILDIKVRNQFLYVAANHDGISKWDISDLYNIQKLYEYIPDSLDEAAHDIAFSGDTLFVAYYKKVGVFYDNGASFQKLLTFGHIAGNGYIAGGEVKDTVYAYTVARNGYSGNIPDGVYFRNTATFSFISSYQQTYAAPEDVVFGKNTSLLHVMGGSQTTYNPCDPRGLFYSLDISGLGTSPPSLVFSDTLPGFQLFCLQVATASALNCVNINDTLYVATLAGLTTGSWTDADSARIYVYDATNPSNVNLITRIYAGLWHFDCDVNGNRIYVASEWYGIKTLDITNLPGETDLGNTLTGGWAMKGDKYGNSMVLANEGYGFKRFDVSDIAQPFLTGVATYTGNAPGFCQDVKFSTFGNYIYSLFMTYQQFRIYDAGTLSLVGDIQNIGGVGYGNSDMLVWGNRVFVGSNGTASDSLRVIDAFNPSAPYIDTTIAIKFNDMKISNGKIFLANDSGVYVFDVTSGIPVLLAKNYFIENYHDGKQITVVNDTVFVWVAWKGLVRYIYSSFSNSIDEDTVTASHLFNGNPQAMAADENGLYVAWTKYGLFAFDKLSLEQKSWYRTGFDLKGHTDNWPVTDLYCKDGYIFLNEYFGQTTILTNNNSSSFKTHEDVFQADVKIFPNPGRELLNVVINLNEPSEAKISIYDTRGILLKSTDVYKFIAGNNTAAISIGEFTAGVYVLEVASSKINEKMRFVKY